MDPAISPPSQPKACASVDIARAAKEDLKKELEARGIQVALGIGFAADGGYAIAVRISPDHGLSDDQIQEVKAIRVHNGVPLDVAITARITAH